MQYIGGALYHICNMCCIKNVGLRAVGQVYYSKRHNSSEPVHRELFNVQFNHYLHNSIVLYRFGGFEWGMYIIEVESQQGRRLHRKKLKNKK